MFRIHHETVLIRTMLQSKGMAKLMQHQFYQMIVSQLLSRRHCCGNDCYMRTDRAETKDAIGR